MPKTLDQYKPLYNKYNMSTGYAPEDEAIIGGATEMVKNAAMSLVYAGFNPREINTLLSDYIEMTLSELILRNALELRKAERAKERAGNV